MKGLIEKRNRLQEELEAFESCPIRQNQYGRGEWILRRRFEILDLDKEIKAGQEVKSHEESYS